MDFGIGIATSSDSWKLALRAEELGFTHAWFYDTQMITADCFVAMAAATLKTSRIRLGTGVLVPSNRIAAVTANAVATLNGLAPGRIDFGICTGFSARGPMGLGAVRVADMGELIPVVYRGVCDKPRRAQPSPSRGPPISTGRAGRTPRGWWKRSRPRLPVMSRCPAIMIRRTPAI